MNRQADPADRSEVAAPSVTGLAGQRGGPSPVQLPRHLYVHVPLCRSKCAYCDFFSRVDDGSVGHAELVEATLDLVAGWLEHPVCPVPLETLYVGGGTPTVLGDGLVDLLRGITTAMPLAQGAEVTVEANPESLTPELVTTLAAAGVTRVSLGVQSLDDGTLRLLGRCHDAAQALSAIRSVLRAGLHVSVDLICGVPGESLATWTRTLEAVVGEGVPHVSVYPLTIEPGTPMEKMIAAGRLSALDEDAAVDAMKAAEAVLTACGYSRYEVANYALPGHESRHNSAYWMGAPYLGIGGGAHGMLDGRQARAVGLVPEDGGDIARVRYGYAPRSFPALESSPFAFFETLSAADARREDAMLGMRMTCGIADELAEQADVLGALESLVADGLVFREHGRWRPTERGWLFGNEVFGRIWDAPG